MRRLPDYLPALRGSALSLLASDRLTRAVGDRAGAEREMREAIRHQPDYAAAHNNLASLLAGKGETRQAEYHFEKAIVIEPNNAGFRRNFELYSVVLLCLLACPSMAQRRPAVSVLPYRFLLVVGDQWKDPASSIVEGGGEFNTIVALMKTWGLPFDIWRLDQQRLDQYHLLDRDGLPRYGTIIWDAGAEHARDKGIELVPQLVKDHGVNLVVLGDTVSAPDVSGLTGVRYISDFVSRENPVITEQHFLTRDSKGDLLPEGAYWPGYKVLAENAEALMKRATHPFLTMRQGQGGGRVVWLGVHRTGDQMQRQVARDLFKRCLVWAQGFALYAEYPKSVILFMDDMGTSDKSYLPYWHYLSPAEEQIRKGLIEPLKRHNAVMVQNVSTGFVDRQSQRVLNPWRQSHVVDELVPGRIHDYASTKRGLDAGLREGVFEIQAHGWTHMLPDLDSPPGPFWTAPMDGVGTYNWYQEFGDPVRKKEVPAIWQMFHLRRAIECIQEDFGVRPLFVMVPGSGHGTSYPNHTARIAAQLGFGLSYFSGGEYLGPDLVVSLAPVVAYRTWAYDRPLFEIPWTVDAPYFLLHHDRDLSLDAGVFPRLLSHLGSGVRYRTANEYSAYLHAKIERESTAGDLALAVNYDRHYCRFFESRASAWTLHLSDETRHALGITGPEKQTVRIPKGLGRRSVRVGAGGVVVE